jgi:hypothetical protein
MTDVAPCECPVAGFCARHAKTMSERTHKLCQTKPAYRVLWDFQAKAIVAMAGQFAADISAWAASGFPMRSPERTAEIFTTLCQPCEFFKGSGEGGTCKKCRCRLGRTITLNKIALATTSCPIGLWGPESPPDQSDSRTTEHHQHSPIDGQ